MHATLTQRIKDRSAIVGVIGLGYVGLPLAAAFARGGFNTIGFDVDEEKKVAVHAGKSYIGAVRSEELGQLVRDGKLSATTDFSKLAECDAIAICVPTPLTRHREPDLCFVENSAREISKRLRRGQIVVLESTTWPGTTEEVVKPILESGGLKSGSDFYLGFSPEREDPGNADFTTTTTPKVVAGDGEAASLLVRDLYSAVVNKTVVVSTPATAEAVKLTENIFRAVNIALVNELKVVYDAMGIDIWEVIEAAKTKPFGFMPFYPGPGLGGHCIPIDPFYLTWKAHEYDLSTRFIELAGEINVSMPRFVISKLEKALDRHQSVSLGSSKVLIVGLAYKKNISDIRESPALKLIELLESRGVVVDFYDPYVPEIPNTREHAELAGRRSVVESESVYARYNAVLICTDHDNVDYEAIRNSAQLVVDTRNVMEKLGFTSERVVKA